MLITGIKSKPVYAPLKADVRGRFHLMLGLGVGAAPLLRVLEEMRGAAAQALEHTRVLFVAGAGSAAPEIEQFRAAQVGEVLAFDASPALLDRFRATLQASLMGTRLYVAGPESFIGLAMKIALEFNLNKDEIRAEECGTLARRVYCIHCRATTESVRTNIVQCAGCRHWLLVRDHYSRRLAAYMGVMADAEAPGELPPVKEVFL
jgi:dimethylamine monooxygenase subunit C